VFTCAIDGDHNHIKGRPGWQGAEIKIAARVGRRFLKNHIGVRSVLLFERDEDGSSRDGQHRH